MMMGRVIQLMGMPHICHIFRYYIRRRFIILIYLEIIVIVVSVKEKGGM